MVHRGAKSLASQGIKCRGHEYLRIIFGPEYTVHEHVTRLGRTVSLRRRVNDRS
ncbi:MAG: hypothetical protein ACLPXU_06325 [Acidimicrobiales bacterium]